MGAAKNHTFFKDKRDPMSMQIARSRSSAVLLGSQAEHFGYDRSLGRSRSSHASASFHATNPIAPGEPYAQVKKSGRNVWETMKARGIEIVPSDTGISAKHITSGFVGGYRRQLSICPQA